MHLLARDERLLYDRRSEEILGETLAAFAGFDSSRLDPTEWKFLARRDQITVHRAVSATREGVDSHKRRVIASGFLNARLTDVLGGLYVEDDNELLTTQAILNPSGCIAVDAAVLMVAERRQVRATPFRFAGVKWISWKRNVKIGSPPLTIGEGQECDLLTYERMGMALAEQRDKEGCQEVAYHVILSLNKPEWPLNVARGPCFRRADMAFCYLFRKVCEDLVECFTLVDYDCRTSASSRRAADTEMADRVLMITRLPDCALAKRLSGCIRKAKGRQVLMSKTCLRCGSKRKVTDPLRCCCICKKSVCHKCYKLKVTFSMNSQTHEPETDTFCNKCLARIAILTAKKNAQHNTSASANSSSSGSSRDRDRESYSGGSSESNRNSFKFWKKSKDRRVPSPRLEVNRRRHSSPATMIRQAEEHTPNYEGLFQNYDVFGRASDNPRRWHQQEEQEPEREQENIQPQHEKRWRQTTFLANPEAAAAEAVAHFLKQQMIPPVTREKEYTAEVYPVAKTVLKKDGDSPHCEAERAHHLYLERQQRLDELEVHQTSCHRAQHVPITASLRLDPETKPGTISADRIPVASSRIIRRARQQESDDTFRMDLYGRF